MFTFSASRRARSGNRRSIAGTHWHRFRWAGDDAFSGASLYACRCGVVRPAP